ncbi:acyl-CoA dehydrogenase family protein [Nocardia australiensis]|uniref:acyl-CoA dehydrogenase family protein n=1 Tax=Nocardia australiensis TaxID=2887191 RepID=UPI001D1352B4|nr:acyl-CoA dehydrogenase family protein [Nocardia australiensis]
MNITTSPTDEATGFIDDDFTEQRPLPANLVPDLNGVNAFTTDKVASAVIAKYAPWSQENASRLGDKVWAPHTLQIARDAQRFTPELRTLDRVGNRLDMVEFHPAYHDLMSMAFEAGVHALAWSSTEHGSHTARAVQSYLWNQVDGSTACPTGMAYASYPMLRDTPELGPWAEQIVKHRYDGAFAPIETKSGGSGIAYAMTEKQGGSDLRANITVARPVGKRGPGEAYIVNGHKWFCSAPMSDGYFTVAQTKGGVSCLFVPRWLPDGTRNNIQINRLKDKLGNRANASSEIEYHDAYAYLVGEEGRGVRTILTSAEYTRSDFAIGSAGLMRAALSQALHYNDYRSAFGLKLSQLPIQAPVLADLALEWAGAAHLGFRVARAEDNHNDVSEALVARLLTPVAKFWNCRRVPTVVEEAMQAIGGNAYIEEHPMPRYYREAPLNAIWEGTSNMMVMDVSRVLVREPKAIEPILDEIRPAAADNAALAQAVDDIEELIKTPEATARHLVTKISLSVQAALLLEHAPTTVAEAFISTRLGTGWGPGFGTIQNVDFEAIIDFARLS